MPHFNCTDCAFHNCSSIGTGGGVTVQPTARITLVNPKFVDCLAGASSPETQSQHSGSCTNTPGLVS